MINKTDLQNQKRSKSQYTQGNLSNNPKITIKQVGTYSPQKQILNVYNVCQQGTHPYNQGQTIAQNYQNQKNYIFQNQKKTYQQQYNQQNIAQQQNVQKHFNISLFEPQQKDQNVFDETIEEEGKALNTKKSISEASQHQQRNNHYKSQQNYFVNEKNKAKQIIIVSNSNHNSQKCFPQQNTNLQSKTKPLIANEEFVTQNNTDSQLLQYQSEIIIKSNQCIYCKDFIQEAQIQLNCFHFFHIQCFQEFIKNQIQMYEEQQQISCLCNIKISKIPFIEVSLNQKWQQEILKKQEELIFQKYHKTFKKCQNKKCNFFWIIDQFRFDEQCVQCIK